MVRKRTGSGVPSDLTTFEQALLKAPHARAVFEDMTRCRGVSREKLLSLLYRIPHLPATKRPLVEGMQDRILKQLPNQIRRWSDTIEKVNRSPSLTPEHLPHWAEAIENPENFSPPLNRTLDSKWATITAGRFSEIPGVLRLYADHLHAVLELFYGRGRQRLGFGYGIRLQPWFTLELLKLVRDSTGGFHAIHRLQPC